MSTAVSPPPDPLADAPEAPGTSSSNFTLLYIIIAVLAGVILYMAIRHCQSVLAEWRRLQAGGHAEAEASGTRLIGLSADDIAALPTFTYRARDASASPSHGGGRRSRSKGRTTPGRAGAAVECVVCLQEMEDGDVVRVLPACRHFFHGGCIDAWLRAHSTCPVCRAHPEPQRPRLAEAAMSMSMSPPLPQLRRCGVSPERPTASRVLADILAQSPLRNSCSCSTSGFGENITVSKSPSPRLHFGSRTPSPTPQVYGRLDGTCSKTAPPGVSEIVVVPSKSPSPMRFSTSRQLTARSVGTLESIEVIASASPSPAPIREDGGGSLSKSQ
ncbi:hypothetical protein BDA96_10G205200 [Sorghum bicolor]|uniref:RING-type E3 ubiquitin transferase n=2 Tax=Sorghum bicolor TaxID=4558 RepID=A0A921U1K7_SORBI|nr:E3 ubiquitin-protein ligase ATL41 [Sorghum bicolor]EER88449.1 hypothetical protein SORBI_3010G156800 [Sorghum bicolor]KAG0514585.1 hypothetical protein BDA96_10G205200 [Sorghum bicolor]|eukprot:XP_002437082.1 E3 ubiquitin-protein ligase ATL41 [Sorghum bicolor]